MMNHTNCDHESSSKARARCRKGLGLAPAGDAAPRKPKVTKISDNHPVDPSRCCTNCRLRQIEWRGTDLITRITMQVCDLCKYLLDKETKIEYLEV